MRPRRRPTTRRISRSAFVPPFPRYIANTRIGHPRQIRHPESAGGQHAWRRPLSSESISGLDGRYGREADALWPGGWAALVAGPRKLTISSSSRCFVTFVAGAVAQFVMRGFPAPAQRDYRSRRRVRSPPPSPLGAGAARQGERPERQAPNL